MLLFAALVLLVMAGVARGESEAQEQIGREGEGAGELHGPRGLAVGPIDGQVVVADLNNRRISAFEADGTFVHAFGWGVSNGAAELQVCATACVAGIPGAGSGQLNQAVGVAIDQSTSDAYVVDRGNNRVQKFDSSGNFILMFGGKVNKTKVAEREAQEAAGGPVTVTAQEENLCTAASGDTCGAGVAGGADGQFQSWPSRAFIAVAAGGTVFVGDRARVQYFEPDGTWKGSFSLAGISSTAIVTGLAVGSGGNVFVAVFGVPGVREFEPTAGSYVESPARFDASSTALEAIAVGPAGDLFVLDGSGEGHISRYAPDGTEEARFAFGEVEPLSAGMAFDPTEERLLVSQPARGTIVVVHPPPPGPLLTPAAELSSGPATTAITVHGLVDPEGAPTTFHVEYGTTASYGATTAESGPIGEGFDRLPIEARLEGLAPGTTYHYRVVATNRDGTVIGPDRTFTTYGTAPFSLPDGRGFEQVSPVDKESGEVGTPGGGSGVSSLTVTPQQVAPGGGGIAYRSFTAFGEPVSAPGISNYLGFRGAGAWSNWNISPPSTEGFTRDPFLAFSEDLTEAVIKSRSPALTADAAEGYWNLYLRDDATGAIRAITAVTPQVPAGAEYCVNYIGADPGFDTVMLEAENGALTPGAPESGRALYEWSAARGLQLITAVSENASGFGPGETQGCGTDANALVLRHAISDDGSRVFWTEGFGSSIETFVRENGRNVSLGQGRFLAANASGSRAFVQSAGHLYMHELPSGELVDITPPIEGTYYPLGLSEDGAYLYYVAETPRSGRRVYVWHGDPATGAATTTYIATLAPGNGGDESTWTPGLGQTARVTPDGHYLAFLSTEGLAGNSTADPVTGEDHREVYLYDAGDGRLVCASCSPTGAAPTGDSTVPGWTTREQQPRYLSDDGGRLFFESTDPLSLHDTNGRQDVYEWERSGLGSCTAASPGYSDASGGCVFPITPGTSGDESYFFDASANGDDIFVATRQHLTASDEDERYDIYDARVGGGFPPPQPPSAPCLGDVCRPGSGLGPAAPGPGSASFVGPGNPRGQHGCLALHRQAKKLSRRARRLRRAARQGDVAHRRASRRRAHRLGRRAEQVHARASRCERGAAGRRVSR